MAGSFSDYLELELLDHVFGNAAYTAPATLYIGLYTAAPTDSSTGSSGGTEVSGGSYAREPVTNNATNFPAASGGAKENGTAVTFDQATANWGNVVAFGIFDAATNGNLLAWADLTAPKDVDDGDTASFAAGDIDITLT